MTVSGILLIEASMEGDLAMEHDRRTQIETFRAMRRAIDRPLSLYHERIHDIQGLRNVLAHCREQNGIAGETALGESSDREATNIQYIHVSSHGTKSCLKIPCIANRAKKSTDRDLVNAFALLGNTPIRALLLSSCETGQNEKLARLIMDKTRIRAVVAYPEVAYDHVCSIAEQLLYFQLLRKRKLPVWSAVRRVNDALVILGERENRLLACWTMEKGKFDGPAPWWEDVEGESDRTLRSYIGSIKQMRTSRGPISKSNLSLMRKIMKCI